jgi:translocation and assembly module TamA
MGMLNRTALIMFLSMAFSARLLAAEPVVVRVEGVEGEPRKNVEAALALPPGLIKDGKVDRLWLEHFSRQAETRVREALEPFGYYGSMVATTLEGNEESGYRLLVTVKTGEQTRISVAEVGLQGEGAGEALLREKVAAFPLRRGDILLHEQYESAKGDLLAAARELGYLDADFSVHEIRVEPATASARIRLVMASGPRYYFGETTLEGTSYYPEDLLRRYIPFSAGEPFSYKALGKTQFNFAGSPYVKSVSVLPDREGATAYRVPVVIRVVPSPRRTIRPGVGYGTDTGFRASVSYRDLSLFYPGHTLNTEITVAEKFQGLGIAYGIPSHKRLDTVTTLQLNLQREDVNDTLSRLLALELDRTRGFGGNRLATVFVRFLYEDYSAGLEESTSFLLLPGLRFSQSSYDDLIRPTHGYHFQLETRGTHQVLGSDAGFIQFIAEGGGLMALPWRLSLRTRAKGGATILNDPFADLPNSLRFFAGGDNSVRGYSYRSLGPRDDSGDVVGGRNLLQGSVELERALFQKWGVSFFYDAGNAFDSSNDFKIFQGVGIGLHYYTPIGAINLGLARQIGVAEPDFRVHFTIGFQL